jgi:cell division protease FtsH
VFKASIISRRDTLGQVYHQPREELFMHNRDRILADIKVSLSGYVAEKLRFGITSDGVSGDFHNAMKLAHNMVWRFGMGQENILGDYTAIPDSQLSEEIKQKLNLQTQKIIDGCLKDVENLLNKERPILDRFAQELVKREELDYDEIDVIFNEYGKGHPSPLKK